MLEQRTMNADPVGDVPVVNGDHSRHVKRSVASENRELMSRIDGDYRDNPRTFRAILPYAGDMYPGIDAKLNDVAYEGHESPTHPNVTVLLEWPNGNRLDYPSTMGHHQRDPSRRPNKILEVYEAVAGHGLMAIDHPDQAGIDLFMMASGDKVGTPDNCVMTMIGLGRQPFETLDFANPARHVAHKRIQAADGPCLAIREIDGYLIVDLNPRYVNRADGFGVTNPETTEPIRLRLNGDSSADIFQLLSTPAAIEEFRRRGLHLRMPDVAWLAREMNLPVEAVGGSLVDLRKDEPDHPLQRYMFRPEPPDASWIGVLGGGGEIVTNRLEPGIARLDGERRFVCFDRRSADACCAASHAFARWLVPASARETLDELRSGDYSAVHLSTPPSVTGEMLLGMINLPVACVTAEKPWFVDLDQARDFAGRVGSSSVAFRFWDHYLARATIAWLRSQSLQDLIGGDVLSMDIQLHEASPPTSPAQIEAGILADLAIHGASLVRAFLPNRALAVTQAQAVKLAGTPGTGETFVTLQMEAIETSDSPSGNRPVVRISAGKYVPRAQAGKTMTIVGPAARLEVDLAADSVDRVVEGVRNRLYPSSESSARFEDAYQVLARRLADGTAHRLGFHIDEVLDIWSWLAAARERFAQPLEIRDEASYLAGMAAVR